MQERAQGRPAKRRQGRPAVLLARSPFPAKSGTAKGTMPHGTPDEDAGLDTGYSRHWQAAHALHVHLTAGPRKSLAAPNPQKQSAQSAPAWRDFAPPAALRFLAGHQGAQREAHNSLLWPSSRLEGLRTSGSQRGSQEKARSICCRHRGPELSSPGADEGSLQVPGAGRSASSSQTAQRARGRGMWR